MLIINDSNDIKVIISAKNIEGVKIINLDNINIVDILKYKNFFMLVLRFY